MPDSRSDTEQKLLDWCRQLAQTNARLRALYNAGELTEAERKKLELLRKLTLLNIEVYSDRL